MDIKASLERITYQAHSVYNEPHYSKMLTDNQKPVRIILLHSHAGFWSIFNKLMNYLLYYKDIRAIEFNTSNTVSAFYGNKDFFSEIFETYDKGGGTVVEASGYLTYEATGCYASWLHLSLSNWRNTYNELFNKYIKIRPEITSRLDKYDLSSSKKISVLIRHPALSKEQPRGKMPSFEQYDEVLQPLLTQDSVIILATDVLEAYEYFLGKYKNHRIIHPSSLKTTTRQKESQFVFSGDSENAKIAVETVLLLAKGDHFIFPNSNMATAALYINPNIIPHFLIG